MAGIGHFDLDKAADPDADRVDLDKAAVGIGHLDMVVAPDVDRVDSGKADAGYVDMAAAGNVLF
ncbi:hypothetical protein ACFQZE_16335 [Paenibacillus sp. GCM10027627]